MGFSAAHSFRLSQGGVDCEGLEWQAEELAFFLGGIRKHWKCWTVTNSSELTMVLYAKHCAKHLCQIFNCS